MGGGGMSETTTSEDPATQEPAYSKTGGAKRRKYWNPPELEWWQWLFYFFGHVVGWGAFLFLVGAYGWIAFWPETLPQIFCRQCLLVIPIVFILGCIFLVRWVRYNRDIHEEMVQDRSFVEALIEDANWTAERLKSHSKSKTENSDQCAVPLAEAISSEINRLKMATPEGWTYYQTLYLDQLLVDAFDNEEELKARAHLDFPRGLRKG